jgi:hypothetical protein
LTVHGSLEDETTGIEVDGTANNIYAANFDA